MPAPGPGYRAGDGAARLQGALVTGAHGGIGAAIAADLGAGGAQVAVADREAAKITADLTRPGAAAAMVDAAIERLGGWICS